MNVLSVEVCFSFNFFIIGFGKIAKHNNQMYLHNKSIDLFLCLLIIKVLI